LREWDEAIAGHADKLAVLRAMTHDDVNHTTSTHYLLTGKPSPRLTAALAEHGYFPHQDLMGLRKIGQQLQGPAATPFGRVTTGQSNQMLFNLPLDLDLVGSWRQWPRMDGQLQALGHEPSSHANDGREADIQDGQGT
jgi:hypothetical protein